MFVNDINNVATFKRVSIGDRMRKIDIKSLVGWKNNHHLSSGYSEYSDFIYSLIFMNDM